MNDKVVANELEVDQQDTTQVDSAQTDETSLDDLLDQFGSEFDDGTKPPESTETDNKSEISSADVVEMQRFMAEQRATQTENAVLDAAKAVKAAIGDDLPVNISEARIVDSLYGRAARDPKFTQAFINRGQNPDLWGKVLNQYAKEYKADLGKPVDQQITSDRESVVNTIRGTTTAKEEAPNMTGWSDRRFNNWKMTGKDDPAL